MSNFEDGSKIGKSMPILHQDSPFSRLAFIWVNNLVSIIGLSSSPIYNSVLSFTGHALQGSMSSPAL